MKENLEILSLYTCVTKMTIIWCMVPEILRVTDTVFLSVWTVFCPFTHLGTQKIRILKKIKKVSGDITILHMCIINDYHMMYGS